MTMLYLYSTQGCHLCEEAYQLLKQAGVEDQVKKIDIAFDDQLFECYGMRIPVVKSCRPDENHQYDDELGWPFQLNELQLWLGQHGFINHT